MTGPVEDRNSADATGAFWAWASAAYARPGAADSLLAAQDSAGLNVNMALWACWTATRFEDAPDGALRRAAEAIADWHQQVTLPLRAARRGAKPFERHPDFAGAGELRDAIKASELEAERIEINILDRLAFRLLTPADDGDAKARARRNLAAYASLAGAAKREGFSTALLHQIIDHIFDGPREKTPAGREREPS